MLLILKEILEKENMKGKFLLHFNFKRENSLHQPETIERLESFSQPKNRLSHKHIFPIYKMKNKKSEAKNTQNLRISQK